MLYFVRMESQEATDPRDPKELMNRIEKSVFPSLETLQKLEKDRKILGGGVIAGRRAICCVVEANSNEEVAQIFHDLPIWGFCRTEIHPLETFEGRLNLDRKSLSKIKEQY